MTFRETDGSGFVAPSELYDRAPDQTFKRHRNPKSGIKNRATTMPEMSHLDYIREAARMTPQPQMTREEWLAQDQWLPHFP